MYARNFSQVPVYENNTYVGLLTTNTVARWLAPQMREHSGLVADAPVRHALGQAETSVENVLHLPRSMSVSETIWEFTNGAAGGTPVTAIMLTNSGRQDETPLGLIVAADFARLSE